MSELAHNYLINDANLVSYWKFEGNSNDSKGSNNGADTAVTYNVASGRYGQGGNYNGTTSLTTITDAASLKPTTNFSISMWVNSVSVNTIFQSYSQNTAVAGIVMQVDAGGLGWLVSGKNTGTVFNTDYAQIKGTININDGQWHHLVGIWDGANLQFYTDAKAATPVAWANAPAYAATNYVRIGVQVTTGPNGLFWQGSLDDLALFSRALTASEVSSLFNSYNLKNNLRPHLFSPGIAR